MKTSTIKTLIAGGLSCIFMNSSYSDQTTDSGKFKVTKELMESVKNMEHPVILDYKNVNTCEQMNNLIDDYIRKNHEGQTPRGSALIRENGKYILNCSTFNEDDKMLVLAFDVTDIVNKLLTSGDEKTREEMKKYIASFSSSDME